jgi:hypothetical protein
VGCVPRREGRRDLPVLTRSSAERRGHWRARAAVRVGETGWSTTAPACKLSGLCDAPRCWHGCSPLRFPRYRYGWATLAPTSILQGGARPDRPRRRGQGLLPVQRQGVKQDANRMWTRSSRGTRAS